MRKLRIFEHISLDGIIEPTGRGEGDEFERGGWSAPYRSPAGAAMLAEAYGTNYDLLLGRRTYDLWSSFWPKMKGGPFADGLNAATKYVATHRPEGLQWGPAHDLGPDIVAGVRRLKSTNGPDLNVCGSSTITSVLLEHALADEVVLAIYPLLMGQGKRFFAESTLRTELALAASKTTPTGVLLNTYRYVGPLRPKSAPHG